MDRWAEWILERRFGGDADAAERSLAALREVRDRVLDRSELRPGETLLDVGCGDGLIAFGALERGAGRVIFCDVSTDLLGVCRRLAGEDDRCEFVEAAAEELRVIEDESVDVVTTRSVLIYVAEKRRAFAEFSRVLRPGGRLSIFEPINRFSDFRREGQFLGIELGGLAPLGRRLTARYAAMSGGDAAMVDFDERDLMRLAHEAGFPNVDLLLEAAIVHGHPPGGEGLTFDRFLKGAPNPNAPTWEELLDAELSAGEREELVAHVGPRFDAGEMTNRHAVAYLRARK